MNERLLARSQCRCCRTSDRATQGGGKKIAQLTLNGYSNYGNILQKYALHQVLRRYAEDVDVIWSEPNKFLPETWEWNWKPHLFQMLNFPEARRQFTFRIVLQSKFKDFCDRYIDTLFDFRSFEDLTSEYDYFVVGSDQVWNPEWCQTQCFLQFAPKHKRVSYAASIAVPSIPPHLGEFFRRGISGISKISVREQGTADVVRELTGLEPLVVIDPTMLLSANDWRKVARQPAWFRKKYERGYVLSYFLRGEVPPVVKELAEKAKLPTINLFDPNNFDHYTIGIDEFLFLFDNASLIYTNSFHAVAFSILFGRPMVACNLPNDIAKRDMSSRLSHLLNLFDLNDRLASPQNEFRVDNPFEINYSKRETVLRRERDTSRRFLDDALGRVDHED